MTFSMPRILHFAKTVIFLGAVLTSTVCPAKASDTQPLRFGIYPFANAATIQKKFSPLVRWLSKKLSRPVDIIIAPNYITHIRRMGDGKVDLAYAGPSPYVKAHDRFKTVELLAAIHLKNQTNDRMVIITHKDSEIQSIRDLDGKTFAFGDYQSYGSHFLPRFILGEQGISLSRLLAYDYVMSHDNVALSILHRDFDAGGLREDVFLRFKKRPLRVLAGPFSMPPHVLVCRTDLAATLKQTLRSLLLSLTDPVILQAFHPDMEGFIAVNNQEFAQTRRVLAVMEAK